MRLALLHDVYNKTRSSSEAIDVLCKTLAESKKGKADYVITSELAIPYYKYYSPATPLSKIKEELKLNYAKIQKCVDKTKVPAIVGIPSHTKNKLFNSAVLFAPQKNFKVLRNKKNDFLKSTHAEHNTEFIFESGLYPDKPTKIFKNTSIAICAEITRHEIIETLKQHSKLIIVMSYWGDQKIQTRDYGPLLYLKPLLESKKTIIWVNQNDLNTALPVNHTFIVSNGKVTYKSKAEAHQSHIVLVELDALLNVKSVEEVSL